MAWQGSRPRWAETVSWLRARAIFAPARQRPASAAYQTLTESCVIFCRPSVPGGAPSGERDAVAPDQKLADGGIVLAGPGLDDRYRPLDRSIILEVAQHDDVVGQW